MRPTSSSGVEHANRSTSGWPEAANVQTQSAASPRQETPRWDGAPRHRAQTPPLRKAGPPTTSWSDRLLPLTALAVWVHSPVCQAAPRDPPDRFCGDPGNPGRGRFSSRGAAPRGPRLMASSVSTCDEFSSAMSAGDTLTFGCYVGITVAGKTVTIAAGCCHAFTTSDRHHAREATLCRAPHCVCVKSRPCRPRTARPAR
jgi:hypothetical protein